MTDSLFYNRPVASLQTMLRTVSFSDECIPNVLPDGIYGQETAAAAAAFQRSHGLPVTGTVDLATWDQIVAAYDIAVLDTAPAWPIRLNLPAGASYRQGDCHPHICLTQCMLSTIADVYHATGKPDITGILDAQTATAISDFQELCALPATGSLDKRTWKHLVLQYRLSIMHWGL